MSFDPDQFLAQTQPSTAAPGGFDPDKFLSETQPMSLTGLAKNAGHDAMDLVSSIPSTVKNLAMIPKTMMVDAPAMLFNTGKQMVEGKSFGETPLMGEINKLGAVVKHLPDNVMHPYDHPLKAGLDVAGLLAGGKAIGLGSEAAEGMEAASQAAKTVEAGGAAEDVAALAKPAPPAPLNAGRMAPEAPAAAQMPSEAADILKNTINPPPGSSGAPKEPSVPVGATFQDTVANLKNKIPGEVKQPLDQVGEFLQGKYAKAAQKPGWNNIMADYMKEHGQNMTLKELGAAPGQVRKIGVDRAHDLADYALDNGLAGPKVGSIGREKLLPQRLDQAGGAVGAFRKMAADRGAVVNTDELVNQIRTQLDDKYLTGGLHSGEKGTYMKALMELKKSGGRADELADKVSELFQEAKGLDRLKRPSGPVSDVARMARDFNHQQIASKLKPHEMGVYEKALEDYGALTQIREFVKRRGSVDAGGRLGPGSGISRAAIQKFLDAVGYRTEAKIMRNLSDKIRTNPEIAARPQNIFRNYIDEAADAIDEMTDPAQ